MRRALLAALALAALSVGATAVRAPLQRIDRRLWRIFDNGAAPSGGSAAPSTPPAFVFAPASGLGMGTACSGTNPTTADGGTLTFLARASGRTCMKTGEYVGIGNGDLVKLAANQYAVQPGGDGSGPLGLSVWQEGYNLSTGSENLDSDWTAFGSGAPAPSVTANAAVAPDGTNTAERVQLAACGGSARSFVYNTCALLDGGSSITRSVSCFVKGRLDGGTTEMLWGGGPGGWFVGPCTYNTSTWTRCRMGGANPLGASLVAFGNFLDYPGSTFDQDIYVWGCQCEDGNLVSPYIPTASGATGKRGGEQVTASVTMGAAVSLAATAVSPRSFSDDVRAVSVATSASNETTLGILGAKEICDFNISGAHTSLIGRDSFVDPAPESATACTYGASSSRACTGTACIPTSGALSLATGAATIYIGGWQDGGAANGTVKSVCFDSTATGCQPAGTSDVTCPAVVDNAHTLVLVGDSIMEGFASAVPVNTEVSDYICASGRTSVSYAVTGSTIADCKNQFDAGRQAYPGARALVSNCGINDLNAGVPGHTAFTSYRPLLDIARDAGYPLVLGTLTPCNGYSNCHPNEVLDFNSDLTAYCAAYPSTVTCVNNYANLGNATEYLFPSSSTYLGSQCVPTSDYLHPNTYCSMLLADDFAAAAP